MIIGTGLIATAFKEIRAPSDDAWIYAAGVSNSGCIDATEFARERARLSDALRAGAQAKVFVYFSTCSIGDASAANSAYVQHKLDMERLVAGHPNFLVVRLPQAAGRTPNPHTLLNFLYARIARSESLTLWRNATRNIIDVVDAATIVRQMIEDREPLRQVVNVANPTSRPILEIVRAMERVTGKVAMLRMVDAGTAYDVDIREVEPVIARLGLSFDYGYVDRVIQKYYGRA